MKETARQQVHDTAHRASAQAEKVLGGAASFSAQTDHPLQHTDNAAEPAQFFMPFWKKVAAGVGLVGGAITALVAAPVVAVSGGLVALGSAAYLAYRHFTDEQRGLKNLRDELDDVDDAVLIDILDEVLTIADDPHVDISASSNATPGGETSRKDPDNRQMGHNVVLDERIGDNVKRMSYLLHELVHISADREYGVNAEQDANFFNVEIDPLSNTPQRAQFDQTHLDHTQRINQVQAALDLDNVLPQTEIEYVNGRLEYSRKKPNKEFDTVMSELLLYLRKKDYQNAPTYAAVQTQAQFAYNRRH